MAILVTSDVHANLAALEAVLADAGPVDAVVSLGDMVGYGAQPNEVVARLREVGATCVAGNHEWAALGRLDTAEFNPAAAAAARWTATALEKRTREYLEGLPVRGTIEGLQMVHGSPRDPIWEYVLSPLIAAASFDHFGGPLCLHGHTHVPAVYRQAPTGRVATTPDRFGSGQTAHIEGEMRYLVNPGSVGQPRDGDPRAAYMLLDMPAQTVTWRRVEYDVEATQALIRDAGLPDILWQRLSFGR